MDIFITNYSEYSIKIIPKNDKKQKRPHGAFL